jgi:hypothetical protein
MNIKEMYGEWLVESDEDKHLRELAEAYHARCEAYDRTVCTGRHPKTGEAIPLTPSELGLINKHARAVREAVIREGESRGLTKEQVGQAIRHYCK